MITGILALRLSCLLGIMIGCIILAWNRKAKFLDCKEDGYKFGEPWFPIKILCIMVKIMLYCLILGSIIFYMRIHNWL